jgi:hypothetical protein
MRSKAMHSRVGSLEQASTPAARLIWIEDWETTDELIAEMLASGAISNADEATLFGWHGSEDHVPGAS